MVSRSEAGGEIDGAETDCVAGSPPAPLHATASDRSQPTMTPDARALRSRMGHLSEACGGISVRAISGNDVPSPEFLLLTRNRGTRDAPCGLPRLAARP